MEFRLLGPLEVRRAGEPVPLGGARDRSVLAALLLRANQVASAGYLVDAAWERPPASPDTNLRTYIARLRGRLGPDRSRLVTREGGYLIAVQPGELDLAVFDRLTERAGAALARSDHRPAATAYRQALDLWRDEPMPDQRHGPGLLAELARLADRRIDALEGYARAKTALGEAGDVVDELSRFVAEHPLREELWAQLLLALYRTGRRAEALATYTRVRARLADDAGVDPGPRLRQVHAAILRDDADLTAPAPASPTAVPAQLPADLPAFTGRSAEGDQLVALLSAGPNPGAVSVAAIDGMAGIGKTTLVVHVAHRLRNRYPDGQLFLDLHGHTEGVEPVRPGEALDRMLRALGIAGERIPPGLEDRAALYRSTLADRRVLVLLDNAAAEGQVAPLLPADPGCAVLLTSRRRLTGLDAAVPVSLDLLPPADAVALFTRIAGPERLTGDLVHDVVELCGHLPLAIRIAAARLRSRTGWTLAHLADRLSDQRRRLAELDLGPRGVAAAFRLSYQQLTGEQRRIFRLLGVHPGADTDAYAVAALANAPVRRVAQVLDELLDVHLLTEPSPGRYVLHDLLRAYAVTAAVAEDAEPDRVAALDRLVDHYLHGAATAMNLAYPSDAHHRPPVAGPGRLELDARTASGWLDQELPNLIGAAEHGRPEQVVGLSRVLARRLLIRGQHDQAVALHNQAREHAHRLADPVAEAHTLIGLGDCHTMCDRYPQAIDCYQQALTLADDGLPQLLALQGLGDIHRLTDRHEESRQYYHRALEVARRIDDPVGELRVLRGLGSGHAVLGEFGPAGTCFERSLELARQTGDRGHEARALASLAMTRRKAGRVAEALTDATRALQIVREVGDRAAEIAVRNELGRDHRLAGQFAAALDQSRQALRIARDLGDRLSESQVLKALGEVHLADGRPDDAADCYRTALAIAREIANRNDEFESLLGLGHARHAAGRLPEALTCSRHALALAEQLRQPHDVSRARDLIADLADDLAGGLAGGLVSR